MKKSILTFVSLLTFILLSGQAQAKFSAPVLKETSQWKIELSAPTETLIKEEQRGKFKTYNLNVTNMGEKAYHVRVEAFRDEKGTDTMFGLAPQMNEEMLDASENMQFINFPIKSGTEKLEIVVTWEGKPNTYKDGGEYPGRKYKETFLITP